MHGKVPMDGIETAELADSPAIVFVVASCIMYAFICLAVGHTVFISTIGWLLFSFRISNWKLHQSGILKKRGSINFIDPNGNPQHDQLEIFPVIFGLQMWHLLIVEVGRWDVGGWLALPEEEGLTLSCFCLESMTKEPNNGKKRESKSSSER